MTTSIGFVKGYVASKLSAKRFAHTERVAEWAETLARRHGVERQPVVLAAYLHDVAKHMALPEMLALLEQCGQTDAHFKDMPQVVHAFAGACLIARDLSIDDARIIEAVKYHTTGHPKMGAVAKVIYIADATESGRDYPKLAQHRALALASLQGALKVVCADTLSYLIARRQMIHPYTIELYNHLIKNEGDNFEY